MAQSTTQPPPDDDDGVSKDALDKLQRYSDMNVRTTTALSKNLDVFIEDKEPLPLALTREVLRGCGNGAKIEVGRVMIQRRGTTRCVNYGDL